jgi:hypothetical protein
LPILTDWQGRLTRETLEEASDFVDLTHEVRYLESKLANHVSFGIVSFLFPRLVKNGLHEQDTEQSQKLEITFST